MRLIIHVIDFFNSLQIRIGIINTTRVCYARSQSVLRLLPPDPDDCLRFRSMCPPTPTPRSTRPCVSAKPSALMTSYSVRAKEGFHYWYRERPKPTSCKYAACVDRMVFVFQLATVRTFSGPVRKRCCCYDNNIRYYRIFLQYRFRENQRWRCNHTHEWDSVYVVAYCERVCVRGFPCVCSEVWLQDFTLTWLSECLNKTTCGVTKPTNMEQITSNIQRSQHVIVPIIFRWYHLIKGLVSLHVFVSEKPH